MKKSGIVILIIMLLSCMIVFSSCGLWFNKTLNYTVRYINESKYSVGNFEYQALDIDKIEINWVFGDVTIIESDKAELSVSEDESNLTTNQKLRYLIEGRTLIIQFWKSNYSGKGNVSKHRKDLTVEIPRNITLEIDQVSGNIESNMLNLKSLDIDIVSGNTRIDTLNVNDLNIENVSGNINIKSINAVDIDIDTVSGNVNLGIVSGKWVEIDSVSGDITLSLSGIGASINFNSVSGHYKNDAKYGDGSCKIDVDTTSGDLIVVP